MRRMRKNTGRMIRLIIATALCLAAIIASVDAAVTSEYSFVNSFGTGSVDIKIEQLQKTDGNTQRIKPIDPVEPIKSMSGNVKPGQHVSYIPRITSERADGYVRLRAMLTAPGKEAFVITEKNLDEISENWVRRGEYFYCTEPLGKGKSAEPFTSVIMPDMENDAQEGQLTIDVAADIIQSENMHPDFGSDAPWGNVEIETAKADDSTQYGVARKSEIEDATLTYQGSKTLEGSTDDLFEGIEYVMAGDTYHGKLTIDNAAKNDARLYFRTFADDHALLEKATLRISFTGEQGEETVYRGALLSKSLSDYKEIALLESGSKGDFVFEISLPENSLNAYSVLNDKVIWQFQTVDINEDGSVVQTGQRFPGTLIMMILIALISGLCAGVEIRRMKNGKSNIQEI